ncbi:MAG TPA: Gfo/Idh/MocA family oxidoreductase, partial [Burkholderiaceae bacterium]|nr:Gfo/Idh/MocA family oxidoreductase [Burkholderiaceae bacterium]
MNHSLRTAIIGMGVISHYYVAAFEQVEECDLVAVCDLDPAKLDAHRAAGRRCTADYRELLAAPGIDAVVVNLPNSLHAQVCREALEAGKHLCCEKPLTLDLQEASALQSLAMQRRLTLLTAFHRRYNHHVIEAKLRDAFKDAVSITAHYDERIED